ncbi:MAG: HAMP domain-containing histidine kinase, partial [Pseudomonadales bacterium]|nr:HAMP domain-containing histidine kinase [Pseudomonadales bacterium]
HPSLPELHFLSIPTQYPEPHLDLETFLAATIHDAKNQIQTIISELSQPGAANATDGQVAGDANVSSTRTEQQLRYLDQRLTAVMGMYRLQTHHICQPTEVYVSDMLTTVADLWGPAEVICEPDLTGWFDESLVRVVISDAVHNARRFARRVIQLSGTLVDGGIELCVEDDGPGFTEAPEARQSGDTGTGLGTYFAEQVVAAHCRDGRQGAVKTGRSPTLGGARFSVWLP